MTTSLLNTLLFGPLPAPQSGRLIRFDVNHEATPEPGAVRQDIIDFLTGHGGPATAAKISMSLGLARSVVSEQLRYLTVCEIVALQGGQSKPRYVLRTYLKTGTQRPQPPRLAHDY